MPLGKARGRMLPFTEAQIAAIRANLSRPDRPPRDLAIFECWLHTLLRVSDFRELMVTDVLGQHGIRDRIAMRQRKVSTAKRCQPVEVGLPPKAREALAAMIEVEGKRPNDFLFTARNRHREPLCRKQLSNLVKAWAREIGMDTHRIAAHSMRRTRPTMQGATFEINPPGSERRQPTQPEDRAWAVEFHYCSKLMAVPTT